MKSLSNAKNELELKYQLSEEALSIYEEKVKKAGFFSVGECLETDITVDLPNFESKSKGIVIRYRIISVGRYLLTIKLKRQNNHYQEYVELEYSSNSNDNLAFSDIQCLLQKELDVVLPWIIQDSLNKQGLDSDRSRICLFDETLRQFAYKKFHS